MRFVIWLLKRYYAYHIFSFEHWVQNDHFNYHCHNSSFSALTALPQFLCQVRYHGLLLLDVITIKWSHKISYTWMYMEKIVLSEMSQRNRNRQKIVIICQIKKEQYHTNIKTKYISYLSKTTELVKSFLSQETMLAKLLLKSSIQFRSKSPWLYAGYASYNTQRCPLSRF